MLEQPDSSDNDMRDKAPGWEAIDAHLASLYGDQEPQHMGTALNYRLGGPDPLDAITIYKRDLPLPHWHYITYGLSELYDKENDDPEVSGFGFELTFRLLARAGDTTAPTWPCSLMQNLARYVFKSGNVFMPGHKMSANGPIALGADTAICSMAFVEDPELAPIETPFGSLSFIQIVGLTEDEQQAVKRWETLKLLAVLLPRMPLWITDLDRASLLTAPHISAQVQAGTARDGSSNGYLYNDLVIVNEQKRWLRGPKTQITLGVSQAMELQTLMPLRIAFGRPIVLSGPHWQLNIEAGEQNSFSVDGPALKVVMAPACVRSFTEQIAPRAGSYVLPQLPGLTWKLQQTLIRDQDGNVVRTIG